MRKRPTLSNAGVLVGSFFLSLLGGTIASYFFNTNQIALLRYEMGQRARAPIVSHEAEPDKNYAVKIQELSNAIRQAQKEQTASGTPKPSRVITAEKLILVNDQGAALGYLGLSPAGLPQLVFYDTSGAERAGLVLSSDGDRVKFFMKSADKGNRSILLNLDNLGMGLGIFNENDAYAGLAIASDGFPKLYLSRHGNASAELSVRDGEAAALKFSDSQGKPRAVLGSVILNTAGQTTTSPLSLNFFEKDGNLIWQAPPEK